LAGKGRASEEASHLTLGLYALHHQSKTANSLNQAGVGLGVAVGKLKRQRDAAGRSGEAVEERFRIALSTETLQALSVHLRGLVMLLRDSNISLDYVQLNEDLLRWQSQEKRGGVCLRWARDYYRELSSNSDK
jgi:CRISPR system Cascade subunit CasB